MTNMDINMVVNEPSKNLLDKELAEVRKVLFSLPKWKLHPILYLIFN